MCTPCDKTKHVHTSWQDKACAHLCMRGASETKEATPSGAIPTLLLGLGRQNAKHGLLIPNICNKHSNIP